MNQAIAKKKQSISRRKELDFSSILCVYKAQNGVWRGFVHPYNITTEASTKAKTLKVLREMSGTYEKILKEYNYPNHLVNKHLLDPEDNNQLGLLVTKSIRDIVKVGYVENKNYYAETQTVSA